MSLIDEFPTLFNYIMNNDKNANTINNANIVIVNIRNILGWKNENNPYARRVRNVADDQNMSELSTITDKDKLVDLLKYIVQIILVCMEDVFADFPKDQLQRAVTNIWNSTKE